MKELKYILAKLPPLDNRGTWPRSRAHNAKLAILSATGKRRYVQTLLRKHGAPLFILSPA